MGIFDQSSYFQAPGLSTWSGGQQQQQPPPLNPAGVSGAFGLYNTAVEQQAKDYDNIMSGYKGFNSSAPMQNFGELAATGGYSEADKQNIRERDVSPIRSIYASANRDVDRQKAIQGGYSPNYGAVKAKMARDLSQTIGDRVTATNAGIAQNVAQNRVGLAPSFASQSFAPLQGQANLYGTTPALANTFGNQAMSSANLQNDIYQSTGSAGMRPDGNGGFYGGVKPPEITQGARVISGGIGRSY